MSKRTRQTISNVAAGAAAVGAVASGAVLLTGAAVSSVPALTTGAVVGGVAIAANLVSNLVSCDSSRSDARHDALAKIR